MSSRWGFGHLGLLSRSCCTSTLLCMYASSLVLQEADAMMVLEAAYCELNAAKAEYAKLAKSAKQKTKDLKEKEETPAPESKKKAREPSS